MSDRGSKQSTPTLDAGQLEKQDDIETQKPDPTPGPPQITYPDGGLEAWLVVLGAVVCNIVA